MQQKGGPSRDATSRDVREFNSALEVEICGQVTHMTALQYHSTATPAKRLENFGYPRDTQAILGSSTKEKATWLDTIDRADLAFLTQVRSPMTCRAG